MPYLIIALRDGHIENAVPIMGEDDTMAVFDSKEEAEEFTRNNILCQHSENIIIDTNAWGIDFH